MKYSIVPSDDQKYIHLKIEGNFTGKDMMQCVMDSHALGIRMDIHSYLVDVRDARNVDSATGNYEFANTDMKSTEGVDTLARVAGLISPGDHSHDFAVTVCTNAGMHLHLFTDLSQALHYILKD